MSQHDTLSLKINEKSSYIDDRNAGCDSHWESLGRMHGGFKQWPNARHIKTDTPWHISFIVGGILLALVIATGHHIYLSFIANTDVNTSTSQFWVRAINNLFSQAIYITLGIVCTYSCIQAAWYTAGSNPTSILTLSHLFLLPTPNAIWGLFRQPYSVRLMPPLFLAICMQALILVTVFSPNALSSGPAAARLANITVPTLNLTETDMSLGPRQINRQLEAAVAPIWEQIISTAMTTPPTTYWRAPQSCGVACSYNLTYFAPGLECRELSENELTLPPVEPWFDGSGRCTRPSKTIFEGTSNFAMNNTNGQHGDNSAYWLLLQYTTGDEQRTREYPCPSYFLPSRALRCTFREAEYRMTYSLSNNIQTVSSSLINHGKPLTDTPPPRDCSLSVPTGAPCPTGSLPPTTEAVNNRALAKVFSTSFHGQIKHSSHQAYPNLSNELAVRQLFTLREWPQPFLFEPSNGVSHLNESIVQLFVNMTMGVMALRTDNTTVESLVWDGSIVWKYDRRTLWLVYGIALSLASLSSLYGMYCLWSNEGAIDPTFATFLLTITRTEHLYKHFKTVRDMKEIEETKIQFSSKAEAFFLANETK
ncbi:hypothetical protein FRC14_006026 [Serendipita sp. 396]|nr:hypothetical protein FRC14_006026 [Serendipita sp. 396]